MKGNAAFDQFYFSQVPFVASALRSEELVDPALIALLEKIGPSVLLSTRRPACSAGRCPTGAPTW